MHKTTIGEIEHRDIETKNYYQLNLLYQSNF